MIKMNELQNENTMQLSMFPDESENSIAEDIEVDDSFFDDEVNVVRAEFISDINEPTISFNNCQLYVNMVCIKKLPEIDYVQFLINKTKNQLALLPCKEDDRDAFLWRTINRKNGKQQPKYITAHIFSAMLFEHMGWDIHTRYKLMGKVKISKGVKLIVFDLSAYKAFTKPTVDVEENAGSSRGYFPSNWKGQFGMPFKEHERTLEVATFKTYATISISGNDNMCHEEITGENNDKL